MSDAFESICISHIYEGLKDGLSHYSAPSRAALIYSMEYGAPPRVYDPQDLLRGHEPKIQEHYIYSSRWRGLRPAGMEVDLFDDQEFHELDMAGIIANGGRSKAVAYQMWFTEEHPDMCSTGPTKAWLEYASRLFSQNYGRGGVDTIDTAGHLLQHCATHAVRDYIVDERSRQGWMDTRIRVYPFLDAVLGVSRTKEEGANPRGRIVVVEPSLLDQVKFICKFPEMERPPLKSFKHVRKMLQAVEFSGRVLISDGVEIVGIALGAMPGSCIIAQFSGSHGFLMVGSELVCSFADGSFHSSNQKANLVQLEEAMLESEMELEQQHKLMRVVQRLVERVRDRKHGCTLIIDLGDELLNTAGQHFDMPLDLMDKGHLKLACSLAKIDGALHISQDLRLHGFACLMDGRSTPGENRSRGARFNSALRFTAEHEDLIVVVVSADRPVSIIRNGVELTAACEWVPVSGTPSPPLVQEWIRG